MTIERADLDAWGLHLYRRLHTLLLRLAGQAPDELLARTREMLAGGDLAYLPDTVTTAAAELGVPLTAGEVQDLRDVLDALGFDDEPTGLAQVTIAEEPDTSPGPHRFRPIGPEPSDEPVDLTDQLLVDALSEQPGTVAVWRTWRITPGVPRRVYLAEVDPEVPAWDVTLAGQHELAEMGESDPQVEVFWSGHDLPPYHRAAQAGATLLWRRA